MPNLDKELKKILEGVLRFGDKSGEVYMGKEITGELDLQVLTEQTNRLKSLFLSFTNELVGEEICPICGSGFDVGCIHQDTLQEIKQRARERLM